MALAWPMVAVLAILCATVLIQMYVPAKRETADLQKQCSALHQRLVAAERRAEDMASGLGDWTRLQMDREKLFEGYRQEVTDLKARLAKLELGRLGRAG